jgi:hypothetical protein
MDGRQNPSNQSSKNVSKPIQMSVADVRKHRQGAHMARDSADGVVSGFQIERRRWTEHKCATCLRLHSRTSRHPPMARSRFPCYGAIISTPMVRFAALSVGGCSAAARTPRPGCTARAPAAATGVGRASPRARSTAAWRRSWSGRTPRENGSRRCGPRQRPGRIAFRPATSPGDSGHPSAAARRARAQRTARAGGVQNMDEDRAPQYP